MEEADGLASDFDLEEEDFHTSSTQRQRRLILDSDEEDIADLFAKDKENGEPC